MTAKILFFLVTYTMNLKIDAKGKITSKAHEDLVVDLRNREELFDMKESLVEGRMIMDIADYPPTGPNHSHTPKSPGKP
ncbi:hypothetical protein CR513_61762, partial [Mucuna pruriens]